MTHSRTTTPSRRLCRGDRRVDGRDVLDLAGLPDVEARPGRGPVGGGGGASGSPPTIPPTTPPGTPPSTPPASPPSMPEVEAGLRHDLGRAPRREPRSPPCATGWAGPRHCRRRRGRRRGRRGRRQLDGRGEERLDLAGVVRQPVVGQQGDDENGGQGERVQDDGRKPGERARRASARTVRSRADLERPARERSNSDMATSGSWGRELSPQEYITRRPVTKVRRGRAFAFVYRCAPFIGAIATSTRP